MSLSIYISSINIDTENFITTFQQLWIVLIWNVDETKF